MPGKKTGEDGLAFESAAPAEGESKNAGLGFVPKEPPEQPPPPSGAGPGGNGNEKNEGQQEVKIGLFRFLQLAPQKSGVRALLSSKHRADVKTKQQWEAVIGDLLCKKTN